MINFISLPLCKNTGTVGNIWLPLKKKRLEIYDWIKIDLQMEIIFFNLKDQVVWPLQKSQIMCYYHYFFEQKAGGDTCIVLSDHQNLDYYTR
jgi:hypothetical protein